MIKQVILFCAFYLSLLSLQVNAQSDCNNLAPFCAGSSGVSFPAGVNNGSAAAGPDYGCLFSQPNPAWYYFQVSTSGNITIGISGSGGNDVDFICWGPFSSPTGNCGNLTAGNTVDCSYSASATETCTIANAIVGQYYILLLTNYSNQPQNINFNQSGGTGSTNCNLIAPVTSATVCSGQPATIYANTNLNSPTFVWAPGGQTTQTITVTPGTTTIYTVTINGTNSAGTATSVVGTGTVTIAPAPTVAITPSLTSMCAGQTQVLTASGSGPFIWTASSGPTPPSTGNVSVSPITTTTYTVLSGTGSCTSTAVATVSVTTTPSISITPTLSSICSGQSQVLTSSGAGPFTWTASGGGNPPAAATVTVSPSSTTTYTVLSGTGSCTAQAVATVSITNTATVSITPSVSAICSGQSHTLTASGSGPFVWTSSTGTPLPTTNSIVISPTGATTYTVISGISSCTAQAVATVTLATISINLSSNSPTYCIGGSSVTLTGNGATNYTWSPAFGLSATTGAMVSASPSVSTTYTLTGNSSGCIDTKTISINVTPISSLNAIASSTVICPSGAGSTVTANGAATYTWMPGSLSGSSTPVNPTSTTTYTVYGQTAQGCITNPAMITVSVAPLVNPNISTPSPLACISQSINLSVTAVTGNTYTWQPTTQLSGINNTSSVVATPNATSSIIYSVTVSNGVCTDSDTILIKILTPPSNNQFIALNNNTICVGGCVTFSATTSGSQPMSYNWYYEGGIGTSSVGIHPEACYPSAGSFSVMSVAYNACGSDTVVNSNFVTVYDYPLPLSSNDTTINIGDHANIWSSGGLTYQWSPNNGSIACPTCSATIVSPTLTTQYVVTVSNSPYCKVQDTVVVIVDINCGDFFVPNAFSPNDDGLNDYINVHGRCIQSFILQIFNRWGEKVFETSSLSESWDGTFRGKKLDTGVFVYKAEGTSIDGQNFKFKGNITLIR